MRELGLDALPLLDRVAARPARTARGRVNAPGLDFYDRLVDELLAARHRAVRDAVPLGPAAGARGRRRLARAGNGGGLRRIRRVVAAGSATASATGSRTNEPWVARLARLRPRRARPGPDEPARRAGRVAPRPSLPRPRGGGPATRGRRTLASASRSTSGRCSRRSDSPEDVAAAREADGDQNRWFLDPLCRGSLSGRHARALRRGRAARRRPATRRRSPRRSTSSASTTTAAEVSRESGERRPHDRAPAGVGHTEMGWEVSPRGLYDVLVRLRDEYAPAAIYDHRERRRVRRRPPPQRARARPGANGVSRRPHRGRRAARSRPACRWRATSCGRCSTTSSGATAIRSASGSSTSTTRRSSASRSRASTGTAISSRRRTATPGPRRRRPACRRSSFPGRDRQEGSPPACGSPRASRPARATMPPR